LLSGNQLADALPSELGQLTALRYFWVANNSLSGALPLELWNLEYLASVDVSNNSLSGIIASVVGMLPSLKYFNARGNMFRGTIPESLCDSLSFLSLSENGMPSFEYGLHFDCTSNLCGCNCTCLA
jgi:Leucine-rich repeat (LRR) protein